MTQKENIELLNKSWEPGGFLDGIHEGIFDRQLFNELYQSLQAIQIDDHENIERELIKLLWFIPIFMHRFKEYVTGISSEEYDGLREDIEEQLARIFGYP
ncbi:MAG: hypothetical protein M3O71_27800 [Bacteroidota bacterium]|nr:hypothetical protein [Bacteroidota bacterium]